MDEYFSVFNGHINQAGEKAEQDIVKKFGKEKYEKEFLPFKKKGIMYMFKVPPTEITTYYVERVTVYVNEKPKKEEVFMEWDETIEEVLG